MPHEAPYAPYSGPCGILIAAWVTVSRMTARSGGEESTVFRAVALETGDRPLRGFKGARARAPSLLMRDTFASKLNGRD